MNGISRPFMNVFVLVHSCVLKESWGTREHLAQVPRSWREHQSYAPLFKYNFFCTEMGWYATPLVSQVSTFYGTWVAKGIAQKPTCTTHTWPFFNFLQYLFLNVIKVMSWHGSYLQDRSEVAKGVHIGPPKHWLQHWAIFRFEFLWLARSESSIQVHWANSSASFTCTWAKQDGSRQVLPGRCPVAFRLIMRLRSLSSFQPGATQARSWSAETFPSGWRSCIYRCPFVVPYLTNHWAYRDRHMRTKRSKRRMSACKDFLKQKNLPLQKLHFSWVNQAGMHSFVSLDSKHSRHFCQETEHDQDLPLLRLRERQLLDEIKSLRAAQHSAIEQLQVM